MSRKGANDEVSEYNPPGFIIEAHKKALDNNEDNQYAPITVPQDNVPMLRWLTHEL